MSDIEWGAPIKVDGVRPDWLDLGQVIAWALEGDKFFYHDLNVGQYIEAGSFPAIGEIRLPATHFAYLAIAKGFEPWAGGYSAPEDWDGEQALRDDGVTIYAPFLGSGWRRGDKPNYIIGYKKRQPEAVSDDAVMVKRMTEADARKQWNGDTSTDMMENGDWHIELLRRLGLIRETTKAETIAQKTGLTVDQVQSVLNEVSHGTR